MTNWSAGWNMGGYLPDVDSVVVVDDYGYAASWILDELERWIEQDGELWDDAEERCTWDARHDEYLLAVQTIEEQRVNGAEILARFPDRNGYDCYLWVTPTTEEISEEE